jgi:hypothetical protein
LHDHPRGRGAALPGGTEGCPDGTVHGQLQVGVIHHHNRVLAAQLQADALQ